MDQRMVDRTYPIQTFYIFYEAMDREGNKVTLQEEWTKNRDRNERNLTAKQNEWRVTEKAYEKDASLLFVSFVQCWDEDLRRDAYSARSWRH